MTALVEIESVSRRFGGYTALSDVSATVDEATIHAVIGPNGAGKTTLFNVVSGVLLPTSGRVRFDGLDYTGRKPDRVLAMGIARNFQQVRLFRGLSVVENVMVGRHARMPSGLRSLLGLGIFDAAAEAEARDKARAELEFVGIGARIEARPAEMTLVDQRRVEIARALASDPRLLLLDEPAAGMNPAEVRDLTALIRRIRDRGVTILLVEHHIRLVMSAADRITVLGAGTVIADGPPQEIQRNERVLSAYLGKSDAAAHGR
jgi:branched-chain amino acid transport system ATP-binding protein